MRQGAVESRNLTSEGQTKVSFMKLTEEEGPNKIGWQGRIARKRQWTVQSIVFFDTCVLEILLGTAESMHMFTPGNNSRMYASFSMTDDLLPYSWI